MDYAIFLPSISTFYNTIVSKQQQTGNYIDPSRLPAEFDRGVEGLNFLNAEQGYFTYKYGLYSAGHATLDINKSKISESMVQGRDRGNTFMVGDSGGFQVGKGLLKFDWNNFEGPASTKVRENILYWLEETADWSVMLDIPAWASDSAHTGRTGLKTVDDCLAKTRYNNEFFLNNRLGKTKFLNVMQGTDWTSAKHWYDGVKEFSDPKIWGDKAVEGWAFASGTRSHMDVLLKLLITMKYDGLLENKKWFHFLGIGQLEWSCYLTSIQRQLREHHDVEIGLSYDCASPFIATANGLVYTTPQHSPKRFTIPMESAPDNKLLSGSNIPFPFESEIGRRLVMGDVCHYAPGMVNKINKIGKTSWDSFSYALIMAHNVYQHIVAVQRANHLMDIERARIQPDWRFWHKLKTSDSAAKYSEWVPRNILYFDRFIKELFETKTKDDAFNMIEKALPFLKDLEFRSRGSGLAANTFSDLFHVEHVTHAEEIDLDNPEDCRLRELDDIVSDDNF